MSGDAVLVQLDSAPDFEKYRGKLRGKFVLLGAPRATPENAINAPMRYSDSSLASIAEPAAPNPARQGLPRPPLNPATFQFPAARYAFLASEQVAAVLLPARGQEGTVFTDNGFPRGADAPAPSNH